MDRAPGCGHVLGRQDCGAPSIPDRRARPLVPVATRLFGQRDRDLFQSHRRAAALARGCSRGARDRDRGDRPLAAAAHRGVDRRCGDRRGVRGRQDRDVGGGGAGTPARHRDRPCGGTSGRDRAAIIRTPHDRRAPADPGAHTGHRPGASAHHAPRQRRFAEPRRRHLGACRALPAVGPRDARRLRFPAQRFLRPPRRGRICEGSRPRAGSGAVVADLAAAIASARERADHGGAPGPHRRHRRGDHRRRDPRRSRDRRPGLSRRRSCAHSRHCGLAYGAGGGAGLFRGARRAGPGAVAHTPNSIPRNARRSRCSASLSATCCCPALRCRRAARST